MAVLTFIFEALRFAKVCLSLFFILYFYLVMIFYEQCLVVLGVSKEAVLCLVNAIVTPTGQALCAILA
jgi:hypothetical protein